MESIYPYKHTLHLLLGIIFLGYVFSDITVISALKNKFGAQTQKDINQALGARSFKIFPLSLLFIILTGGIMMSKYINSDAGFFESSLQKILVFKIILASVIVLGVLYNLFTKFTKREKSKFMQDHFHKLVLVLGLLIVISAKAMFIV